MKAELLNEQLDQNRRKVDFDTYDISVQRMASVVRVAQLTTLPDRSIQGAIGSISPATLELLKTRLRDWLK